MMPHQEKGVTTCRMDAWLAASNGVLAACMDKDGWETGRKTRRHGAES